MVCVRVALVVALAGCVSSQAQVCPDGTLCAGNTICDQRPSGGYRCLTEEQQAACNGLEEGDDCSVGDQPGACRDGSCEPFFCGDGYLTAGEVCDGDVLGMNGEGMVNSCLDAGFYAREGLRCKATCVFDTGECAGGTCGDLTVNGPELCDGDTDRTCLQIGFDAGNVTCNNQCGFQIRDCTRFGWNPESLNGMIGISLGGSGRDDQWAGGDNGKLMRFEGAFWNAVPSGVTNPLIAISAVSKTEAWMVGLAMTSPLLPSVILRWNGTQWTKVPAPAAEYVDIQAFSSTQVFAASNDQGIQAWNGTSWSELGNITGTPIAIRGTAADDLWVATEEGPLWRWNGTTWTSQSTVLPNAKMRFLDANSRTDVWAIGSDEVSPANGVIAHWDGAVWTTWRKNGATWNNVASSGPKDTWVAGADDTMHHFDGVAWSSTLAIGASASGLAAISGLQSYGANEVVAVSTLNLAYRFRGMTFGRYPQLQVFTENSSFWGDRADDLYVGNVDGQIHRYDGTRWTVAFTVPGSAPGAGISVKSMWGYNSNDVWAGTADARVFRWGGVMWSDMAVPSTTPVTHIWGTGPTDTWAFSSAGAFHWDGSAWRRDALGNLPVRSVSGTAPDDVWIVIDTLPTRTVMHYDGSTWSNVDVGTARQVHAVVAVSRTLVYVSAFEGRIMKFNGSTWTEDIVPSVAEIQFMAATATDDVIAASERELFHHDGRQWAPLRPPVDFVPNTPDYIPMRGIQMFPGRVEMLLQRLKVRTLLRTRPIACKAIEDNLCTNAIDDDCDGKIDQLDKPDCP